MELVDALLQLEAAAALVESLLPAELTPEQQMLLLEAWGPPPRRVSATRTRELQAEDWLGLIRSCAGRYEQRPDEPSVDELHRVLIRWATGTPRLRRHKTGHG
jgi:hypothetical protein